MSIRRIILGNRNHCRLVKWVLFLVVLRPSSVDLNSSARREIASFIVVAAANLLISRLSHLLPSNEINDIILTVCRCTIV